MSERNRERLRAAFVAATSFFFVAAPAVYTVWRAGVRGVFSFIYADSFLYLGIAQLSSIGHFTHDGTTPTNGFHPLWQIVLTILYGGRGASAHGALGPIVGSFAIEASLLAVGAALTSLAILRFTRSVLLALLPVPGVYYLLVGVHFENHSIWENLIGMESGLSTFFGGLLFYVLSRHLARDDRPLEQLVADRRLDRLWMMVGLTLPFVVLSRLDDVFVLGTTALVLLAARRPLPDRIRVTLTVVAPSAALLLVFVTFNKVVAGTFLPISGMTKGGLAIASNTFVALGSIFPAVVDVKNAIASKPSVPLEIHANAFRVAQLVFPAIFAGIFMAIVRLTPRRGQGRYVLFAALAGALVIKATYNFVNVRLWHQGTWYYAFPMLLVSFLGAILLGGPYAHAARIRAIRLAAAGLYATIMLITAGRFAVERVYLWPTAEYDFWRDRAAIATRLSAMRPDPKLIAFDDGLVGYALPFPTIHGFGMAADLATHKALKAGHLLRHAYDRGHKIFTSSHYFALPRATTSSDALREFLRGSILEHEVKGELDDFDYKLLFVHEATRAPFIEFEPRHGGGVHAVAPAP